MVLETTWLYILTIAKTSFCSCAAQTLNKQTQADEEFATQQQGS